MNKNSESYKSTYSLLRPSSEAVERVMDMTSEKRIRFKPAFKRLAAAALAFAVLIGGGFGIKYALKKDDSVGELGVLVAYASTGEFMEVGSVNEQDLFYAIYVFPNYDEDASKAAKERYDIDRGKLDELTDKFIEEGYSANIRYGNNSSAATASISTIETGSFALNLNDYSDVKSFRIENASVYGTLEFDYDFYGRLGYTDAPPTDFDDDYFERIETIGFPYPIDCNEFKISGDVLRRSQDSGFYAGGTDKHEINKGYILLWEISDELANAIDNDTNFDLSQIKDTVTFTVEFNDGTVKTASIDLYFDSDGYMHFGK